MTGRTLGHYQAREKRRFLSRGSKAKHLRFSAFIRGFLLACICAWAAEPRELRKLAELREAFNRDQGVPRVVLLLSPT